MNNKRKNKSTLNVFLLFIGIIVIQYQFSSGIQGRDHPNPGNFNEMKMKTKLKVSQKS